MARGTLRFAGEGRPTRSRLSGQRTALKAGERQRIVLRVKSAAARRMLRGGLRGAARVTVSASTSAGSQASRVVAFRLGG